MVTFKLMLQWWLIFLGGLLWLLSGLWLCAGCAGGPRVTVAATSQPVTSRVQSGLVNLERLEFDAALARIEALELGVTAVQFAQPTTATARDVGGDQAGRKVTIGGNGDSVTTWILAAGIAASYPVSRTVRLLWQRAAGTATPATGRAGRPTGRSAATEPRAPATGRAGRPSRTAEQELGRYGGA